MYIFAAKFLSMRKIFTAESKSTRKKIILNCSFCDMSFRYSVVFEVV